MGATAEPGKYPNTHTAMSMRTPRPPAGPLCTPFGETQTLEARPHSSAPRACWRLPGCGGALQDARAGSKEPSNAHEPHPTGLSPTYERGHPAGCPAHKQRRRGGGKRSLRGWNCTTSQRVSTCGELGASPLLGVEAAAVSTQPTQARARSRSHHGYSFHRHGPGAGPGYFLLWSTSARASRHGLQYTLPAA